MGAEARAGTGVAMRGAFDTLRTCMLGLVLINVLFVQLTGAADVAWLLPLYLLTLLAPALHPLRKWAAYRFAWNLAVVALFCLLVRHAAGNDLRFVLQDGLLLGTLCQVHLLNNLGPEQRPDLLFLNSFLIAVATGYLCQDLAYPIAFLFYVPLFVVGLQLLTLTREGREPSRAATRRVVVDGLGRSLKLLAATLLAFLFWPRDFHRSSLFAGEFDFTTATGGAEVAFSEELKLRKHRRVQVSDRVVLSVTLIEGRMQDVPILWRGAVLDTTDGREWWSSETDHMALGRSPEDQWVQRGAQLLRATADGGFDTRLSIEMADPRAGRLFAPLVAEQVVPGSGLHIDGVHPGAGGVLTYRDGAASGAAARYELAFTSAGAGHVGQAAEWTEGMVSRYVALPVSRRVESARRFAERLAGDLGEGASQREIVAAFSEFLERQYEYLPPGAEGAAESLDQFLSTAAGGHCELFASALATMLRSRQIPCRLVTGYRSAEWDGDFETLTFRSRGAHAWVEVHDPETGWYTVDPNPAPAAAGGPSLWARTRTTLSEWWGRLTSFDADGRSGVVAWIGELPARATTWVRRAPGRTALVAVAAILCAVGLRQRRRRGIPPELLAYRRALRRARVARRPGETPRELLERARAEEVAPTRLEALVHATEQHEHACYALRPTP